ncbi:MAG: hydroxymethylbilane synthase, partial [Arenibacter sp.]|nr:hydroxymethylbilane synthase [Arenibacter sp.]
DWMIPAPAQGAMVVVSMENDPYSTEAVRKLNDKKTEISTHVEREFLQVLEGGCTAPIGAIATIHKDSLNFEGVLLSLDGKQKIAVKKSITTQHYKDFGRTCAQEILNNGGSEMMVEIKKELA